MNQLPIIQINNVPRDERIGSVFNELFKIIAQTDEYDRVEWDFSDTLFFHPFFLAPLAIYKDTCKKDIVLRNVPKRLQSYFDLIAFENCKNVCSVQTLESELQSYENKTYTPICKFGINTTDVDGIQSVLQNLIEKQIKADVRIKNPLSYLLSELVCNISQHSQSDNGYIFAQYLAREGCVDICIADAGVTIYGSYIKAKKYLDEIGDDESVAMQFANDGYSTKNLPDAENRGYGIRTSKKIVVEGFGGDFFMLSGSAFHRHNKDGNRYVSLPKEIAWNGTIILIRVPSVVPNNFNIYNFIS